MILWELARASGLVAFAVSTIVVVWGILLSSRALRPAAPQADLHRALSTLVLLLVAVHVGTLLANPHAHVGVGSLVGIGVSLGVLAGVVTLWLTVLLPLTFRLRRSRRMGYALWRRIHYLGYAVWALAFVHGVATGSDGEAWALALYGLAERVGGRGRVLALDGGTLRVAHRTGRTAASRRRPRDPGGDGCDRDGRPAADAATVAARRPGAATVWRRWKKCAGPNPSRSGLRYHGSHRAPRATNGGSPCAFAS